MKGLILLLALMIPGVASADGWVLIAPKLDTSNSKHLELRVSDPVSQWAQLYAFDTARECETAKARMVDAAKKRAKDNYDFDLVSSHVSLCMPYDLWWKSQQPSR